MTPFDSDIETATLEDFLLKSSEGPLSRLPEIEDLRSRAEQLLKRLSAPVRTMIAGEFSAGKSTLTNLLVGERLIPTSVLASALPPIVFRHGAKVTASACWWSGRDPQSFVGADFDALMTVNPDYIVMTAPNPILKKVSIFDTPGTSDPDRESEVLIELSSRAEMIIWCTNAVQAWRESERHMWTQLSPAVTKNGLMAVTHVDLPSVRQGYGRIMARLVKEAGSLFHAILPIDSLSAIEASPLGVVSDAGAWSNSGGAGLVKGVLDLAVSLRKPDVLAARDLIATRLVPAMEEADSIADAPPPSDGDPVPEAEPLASPASVSTPKPKLSAAAAMEKPAPRTAGSGAQKMNPLAGLAKLKDKPRSQAPAEGDSPVDAQAVDVATPNQPAVPLAKTMATAKLVKTPKPLPRKGPHPLLTDWQSKIDALVTLIQNHDDPEESSFITAASDSILEMLDTLAEPGVLNTETNWLLGQTQEALDTVILMQMETGDRVLIDTAILLLQISRDLALIAASAD